MSHVAVLNLPVVPVQADTLIGSVQAVSGELVTDLPLLEATASIGHAV